MIGKIKIMEKDIIVLDLETKKTFDEVGGQENRHLLGVTVVGVYSYNRDEYRGFREEEFGELDTHAPAPANELSENAPT